MYTSASVFDLDHTLLVANSSYLFGKYLYRSGYIPFFSMLYFAGCYAAHKAGLLSLHGLHRRICPQLYQCIPLNIQEIAFQFATDSLHSNLYPPVILRLNEAKQQGHYTAILSSSPDFIVEPFAKLLGVDRWNATSYGNHQVEILDGEKKANILLSISTDLSIPVSNIYAYSDSFYDLPLLHAAGVPIGVNPDRQLRMICMKNNWEIL